MKGGEKVNYWTMAAVIISLLSAGFTAYSTYRTNLSPFDLRLSIGYPLMGRTFDEKKEHYSLTPIINVEFLNTGAKAGEIKDIIVVVKAGSSKWWLQSAYFCKTSGMEVMKEEFREAFHPFILGGKERLSRNILFHPVVQSEPWKAPMRKPNEALPSGTYTFDFYVNAGGKNSLHWVMKKKYEMRNQIVQGLARDNGGSYFLFDDSLIEARKSFEETLSQKP